MGEVYRASHQMLARPAAIKLIRSEILGQSSPDESRIVIERFRREAQASASLSSPHTINLYDFGVSQDGTFYLVMEMLQGLDLDTLVRKFGPQSVERTVSLLQQACDSLAEAHSRGLIHRDIKPSNIFACRMGLAVDFVKVLDFGLVKSLEDGGQRELMLTAKHATAGTPAFMPPEMVLGNAVDHRADIYALGCVAYWLLTGRLVFEAPNVMQVMIQHANAVPTPPSTRVELAIPPEMDQLVLDCLAKDPRQRPATASELSRRLESIVGDGGWTQEQALRWWERHRPEASRSVPELAGGLTLEKAVGSGWTP
jgi:serine/threonine-protein kinase